ncbi:DUF1700 domain-containing protein [Cohnella lupini]|uniref:Putative membrane protein n=1 Tax=Cohnella lupini TaxID=1294267 RepID=A0A3D9I8B5_9BACL|nr:DUF1700 domain-containing protein [Cohnella lupini]RED58002.1 putative membrane protein [Cohnella lupini]
MNKLEFIETLRHYLSSMPEEERNELLRDYDAHFMYGLQNGKTEADIARELGDPLTLAREAVGDHFLPPPPWSPPRRDIPRFVGVTIALFFLNLMIALPVFASVWAAFVALCAATVGAFLSPVAFVADSIFESGFALHKLFVAIGSIGIGMLLLPLVRFVGKWLIFATVKYGQWNYKIWRGRS